MVPTPIGENLAERQSDPGHSDVTDATRGRGDSLLSPLLFCVAVGRNELDDASLLSGDCSCGGECQRVADGAGELLDSGMNGLSRR